MPSVKVILVFEHPFWDDDNSGKVGGSTKTDLPVKQIYYEMNKSKSGNVENGITVFAQIEPKYRIEAHS